MVSGLVRPRSFLVVVVLLATVAASLPVAATPPNQPVNVSASSGPGRGEITLRWSAPVGGADIYYIYETPGSYCSGHCSFSSSSCCNFQLTFTGYGDGVSVSYQVSAVRYTAPFTWEEGPKSPSVSATTFDTPSAPQSLTATADPFLGQITLQWEPPSYTGYGGLFYRIYRGDSSGSETYLGETWSNTYVDSTVGLENAGVYYYQVSAVNDGALLEGARSNEAVASTEFPPCMGPPPCWLAPPPPACVGDPPCPLPPPPPVPACLDLPCGVSSDDGSREAEVLLDEDGEYAFKYVYIEEGQLDQALQARVWMYGRSEGCVNFIFSDSGAQPQALYLNGVLVKRFDPCYLFGPDHGWSFIDLPVEDLLPGYNELYVEDSGDNSGVYLPLEPTTNAAAYGVDTDHSGNSYMCCPWVEGELMWRIELVTVPA